LEGKHCAFVNRHGAFRKQSGKMSIPKKNPKMAFQDKYNFQKDLDYS
jgi:hypothetical protein